jgi:ABC-type nickel/cobalt efflux system permease component RcnA
LPLFSSVVIAGLGLVIAVQALVSGGIVQFNFSMPHVPSSTGLLTTLGLVPVGQLQGQAALLTALGLGFILGLKHALDPDHIVAVSTIVSEHQSLAKSSLIGAVWGIGHTTSLLIVGLLVMGLRLTIPERVVMSLEFGVAVMLIILGANLLRKSLQVELHRHPHAHSRDDRVQPHAHLHVHAPRVHHHEGHQFLRHAKRPLLVGMVHGLAGSAALMLLVLTTIPSPLLGLIYIGVFGLGSVGGMLLISSLIGLPFVLTARRFARINWGIKVTAGAFSAAFGLFLAWQIGFVEGLFR